MGVRVHDAPAELSLDAAEEDGLAEILRRVQLHCAAFEGRLSKKNGRNRLGGRTKGVKSKVVTNVKMGQPLEINDFRVLIFVLVLVLVFAGGIYIYMIYIKVRFFSSHRYTRGGRRRAA